MSFLLYSFVLFLSLRSGFCGNCSEALHDTFRKEVDLTDDCGDCRVLLPVGFFLGSDWSGFCVGEEFFLFEDWECREESELTGGRWSFVAVGEGFCEEMAGSRGLDARCLREFNEEACNRERELKSSGNDTLGGESDEKGFLNLADLNSNLEVGGSIKEGGTATPKPSFRRVPTTTRATTTTEKATTCTSRKSTTETTSTAATTETTSTAATTGTTLTDATTETTSTAATTETTSTAATTETTSTAATTETTSTAATSETTSTAATTETTLTDATTETSTKETTAETSTTTEKTAGKSTTSTEGTTETSPTETTTETSTKKLTTEKPPTEATAETEASPSSTTLISSSWSFSPENAFSSTKSLLPPMKKTCEMNEFFYNDYCYFVKYYEETWKNSDGFLINSVKSCQERHPKALGLAVETKEENQNILEGLKTIHLYESSIIFTSGVRINGLRGEWLGWNRTINESVLNLKEPQYLEVPVGFYCINSCEGFWYLFEPKEDSLRNQKTFLIMCKRPYNPKNIELKLHERCLELYRKSPCYSLQKHQNFCCARDDQGELWFVCPDKTEFQYSNGVQCSWVCGDDGFYIKDRPTCYGKSGCSATYNEVRYSAPPQRFAISGCPRHSYGYSTWFCGSNKSFSGTPDYSSCCDLGSPKCKDMDVFLNTWMGCPSRNITKRSTCPPGSVNSEAVIQWYCQGNGIFLGSTPDYSNCNRSKSDLICFKKDRFGREWTGLPGTTSRKECPAAFRGDCFWRCRSSGVFEGPEPDCSKCKAAWMDDIAEKIKNDSQHEEVMEIMENYTKHEDVRIGFSHVINLTAECVTLYKRQTNETITAFDKFLKSFSRILKNLAGDSNIWSSFPEADREEYVDRVLDTTQKAAFANLETTPTPREQYNVTLTTSGVEGFDFFVAYNPPTGTDFPLQDLPQSDWHLSIKEMNESAESFAAMGLVMNSSLGSSMFPRGNASKDLEVNAPVVTFTVAAAADGEVAIDPNVSVVVSFRHTNRTRFPATQVIRRKLHAGEHPSGVFSSTLCFHYSDSDWTTEGCSVTFTSKDRTNCTCNHLSTIGLLMSVHKYEPNRILEFISVVCSGITVVSLVLALFVFYFFDKGNNDRVLIGKNLCFCLLVGHIMLCSVMDKKFFNTSDTLCRVVAIILHYVFMSAFAWMFVEGCHLYRMLVLVFDSDVDYRWIYLLIGYGVPLAVVGVTEVVGFILQEQPYGSDELCWLKAPKYVWAFIAPVTVITSINFCILIVAMKLAISSKRRTEKSNLGTVKLWVKGWISLSTLLGVTWLFGLGYICYSETFAYAFVVFNGLQGFFIFIFRCVFSEQYKSVFLRKIKSWFSNSKAEAFRKIENVKSETRVFAVSGTKSSSGETEAKDSGYDTTNDSGARSRNYSFGGLATKSRGRKQREGPGGIGIDINVTLTPALSEAYLRNRMIAKNFSARKSKATLLAEKSFPELSYHDAFRE